jgi:hypothetical protein
MFDGGRSVAVQTLDDDLLIELPGSKAADTIDQSRFCTAPSPGT